MQNRWSMAMLAAPLWMAACSSEPAPRAEANVAETEATQANRVVSSGKEEVPLADVPAEVLAVARTAQPGFTPEEAERETRDGRLYYDIEGRLPDGSEVEFDIMADGDGWRVVETQRDIAFGDVPEPARQAALARNPRLAPVRVIESVQTDGVIIYELYESAPGEDPERKTEVRWDGRAASVLEQEWVH